MSASTSALTVKVGELLHQHFGDFQSPALEEVHRLLNEIEARQSELEHEIEEFRAAQRRHEAHQDRYVTERRRAEEAIEHERNLLRTLIDNLPDCVYVKDDESRFVTANLATAQIVGARTPNELVGRTDFDFYPPELAAEYRADEEEILRSGQSLVNKDEPHICQGRPRTVLTTKVPLKDREGRAIGLVGISRDITESKEVEKSLRQAKADAEKANQAKSRFLAFVSHDLRTPVNSILGMIDLALAKTTDPTLKDFLETAKDSADFLLALLNDLLDLARIESGKLELEAAPFSLRRVLDQAARVLSVRASHKGISFSCCIPPEVPDALIGDQVRLRQIILNLAGNGVKFTAQGEVEVRVRVDSQSAEEVCLQFAVRDTGIGIPLSEQKRIFHPYTQADLSTTRRFGGTGLGLTISTRLVAMMHGRIWVESEPELGSTFYFTARLPLAKGLPAETEAAPEVLAPRTSVLRVLLVEDNPANQKLATYVLKDRGHVVEIAESGRQALHMMEQGHYDVILMDLSMPGMDGLETTAAIRVREGEGSRVPIIAMTAHAMKGDRQRCLEAGMDAYLSKPIDGRQMIALVETLAAARAALEAAGVAPAIACPTARPAESLAADADVFDLQAAIKLCLGREDAFATMAIDFFNDVGRLLVEMRSALQRGDVTEVGHLGHRLKGTVLYLGAKRATDAALRVEQFVASGGPLRDAKEAVVALERECDALKTALAPHRPVAGPRTSWPQ